MINGGTVNPNASLSWSDFVALPACKIVSAVSVFDAFDKRGAFRVDLQLKLYRRQGRFAL